MDENNVTIPPETAKALAAFRDALAGLQAAGLVPDSTGAIAPATAAPADAITEQPQAQTEKPATAPNLVGEFIRWFITSPEDQLYDVKRGQWECVTGYRNSEEDKRAHRLVFHSRIQSRGVADDIICIRPLGSKLAVFNASRITYGAGWSAQKQPQAIAEECGAAPVPFENVVSNGNVNDRRGAAIEGAGLDLSKLEIIDWTGAEDMFIPPVQTQRWTSTTFQVINRHFAGAIAMRVEDQYFLFDADREEVECHGFNPFFTQLPRPVTSVEDAYRALMPDAVAAAMEEGYPVIRQGEFFFVQVDEEEVRDRLIDAHNPRELFFYEQVTDRLTEMGAAMVNCANRTQQLEVEQFMEKCEEHNGGNIDKSADAASDVLGDYLAQLRYQVGPDEAAYDPEVEEPDGERKSSRTGLRPAQTHRSWIADELEARLEFSDDEDSQDRGGTDGKLGIRFDVRIGSDNTGRGFQRSMQQHLATGVIEHDDDTAYAIGAVIHQGREHRPVFLDGWHRVYPNTATNNWTVSGDVD